MPIIDPNAPAEANIVVQTRRGTSIENNQSFDVTYWDEVVDRDLRAKHLGAKFRTGLCPVYNCHGLTFASRRTRIWRPESVPTILQEDAYELIPEDEVLPGDVIIYTGDDGDAEHSGIVVEVRTLGSIRTPWICSKWGPGSEVVHSWGDCEYNLANVKYYRVTK